MIPAHLVEALRALLGDRVSTTTADLEQHSHGESFHAPHPPDVVVWPASTEEVAAVVRLCAAERVPVVPFGAGTSLEGHVAAVRGGVTVDLTRMARILDIRDEDLDATVQAGVTRKQLNAQLERRGLFFAVDPGADATLGGMASTRASGTNAVRYGTMRDNVLQLSVVLADGRVITTGTRARKSSAGYDLTRLFVGAEGTLGIITELTVRLYGVPEAISAAVCGFPDVRSAVTCVMEAIQLGVPVARIELLDEVQIAACNAFSGLELAVVPTLFFEFHGTTRGVDEDARTVQEIAARHGGTSFEWATRPEDRSRLWAARHDAYYAGRALRPGGQGIATDVCVPISRLADCILETKADLVDCPVPVALLGHVGDGNFHLTFVVDPAVPEEHAVVEELHARLVHRALGMGGTCTGEHGIGMGKLDFLVAEHGDAVEVMARIKRALDPDGILNPGKVLRT